MVSRLFYGHFRSKKQALCVYICKTVYLVKFSENYVFVFIVLKSFVGSSEQVLSIIICHNDEKGMGIKKFREGLK